MNTSTQFSIRTLLIVTLVVGVAVAILVSGNRYLIQISGWVLAANLVGAIVALIVTYAMKIPRDGSLRGNPDDDSVDEKPKG